MVLLASCNVFRQTFLSLSFGTLLYVCVLNEHFPIINTRTKTDDVIPAILLMNDKLQSSYDF
jgi:hypothetical protein